MKNVKKKHSDSKSRKERRKHEQTKVKQWKLEMNQFFKERKTGRAVIPKKLRIQILDKTNGRCGYCGIPLPSKWTVDHMHPLAKGGSNEIENLIAACSSCNNYKGKDTVNEFRRNIMDVLRKLRENNSQYALSLRYNIVRETPRDIEFYFEKKEMT